MPHARHAVTMMLCLMLPLRASTQTARIRTDTVLLTRDIDFSGKLDYVVRESRTGPIPSMPEHRLAVYLDASPATRAPRWSTPWNDEVEVSVDSVKQLSTGAYLLQLDASYADATSVSYLVITRGRVREDIVFEEDYDNGFAELREERGRHLIDASAKRLRFLGKPLAPRLPCKGAQLPAVLFAFDPRLQAFVIDKTYCAAPRPPAP